MQFGVVDNPKLEGVNKFVKYVQNHPIWSPASTATFARAISMQENAPCHQGKIYQKD
jgi:hypothetical protein